VAYRHGRDSECPSSSVSDAQSVLPLVEIRFIKLTGRLISRIYQSLEVDTGGSLSVARTLGRLYYHIRHPTTSRRSLGPPVGGPLPRLHAGPVLILLPAACQ
jgi:hypothetical protein